MQAVIKFNLSEESPTGIQKYQYLQQFLKQEQMSSFQNFLRLYNKKYVVPTLKAIQETIVFYHNKNIDTLKLGCTLPNLANNCLHKSTDVNSYQFTESDKDLLKKNREGDVGGPSIVFTQKQLLMKLLFDNQKNFCRSFLRIDASQLYLNCK